MKNTKDFITGMADTNGWQEIQRNVSSLQKTSTRPGTLSPARIIDFYFDKTESGVNRFKRQFIDVAESCDQQQTRTLANTLIFARKILSTEALTHYRATHLGLDLADQTETGRHTGIKDLARVDATAETITRAQESKLSGILSVLPENMSLISFRGNESLDEFYGLAELVGIARAGRTPEFVLGYLTNMHDLQGIAQTTQSLINRAPSIYDNLLKANTDDYFAGLMIGLDQALVLANNPTRRNTLLTARQVMHLADQG
jgi:hypothetical protein